MREPGELKEAEVARVPQEMAGPPVGPEINDQLSTGQQENLRDLISEFWNVFKELPGEAQGVEHQIQTLPGRIMHNHWRRLP